MVLIRCGDMRPALVRLGNVPREREGRREREEEEGRRERKEEEGRREREEEEGWKE